MNSGSDATRTLTRVIFVPGESLASCASRLLREGVVKRLPDALLRSLLDVLYAQSRLRKAVRGVARIIPAKSQSPLEITRRGATQVANGGRDLIGINDRYWPATA